MPGVIGVALSILASRDLNESGVSVTADVVGGFEVAPSDVMNPLLDDTPAVPSPVN